MGRFWENEGDQDVESGVAPIPQEGAVIQCCGVVRREQGDTVLEFSTAGDSSVHPLLWERGRKKVKKQKGSIFFSWPAVVHFQGTSLRNIVPLIFLG